MPGNHLLHSGARTLRHITIVESGESLLSREPRVQSRELIN